MLNLSGSAEASSRTPHTPVIVVGVDGSKVSAHALRCAAALARPMNGSIRAVVAWEYPETYGWQALPQDWHPDREARNKLEATIAQAFDGRAPEGTDLVVRGGHAATILLEEARAATMLVVGSRGHGGVTGLLLGSVSAKVAAHAICPVLVVHGEAPSALAA